VTFDNNCHYHYGMGRIDVHSHLLPGVDDGCPTLAESIECARMLVAAGYSHCFCTPHAWPSQHLITRDAVPTMVRELQSALDHANIALRLLPGSELNLHATVTHTTPDRIIELALAGQYILVDMWADKLPAWFEGAVRWLQDMDLKVILAHPERMRVIQDHPELVREIRNMDVLLQGNLQCFADRPDSYTRRTAELLLGDGDYFLLGSDLHNIEGLRTRLAGLKNAIKFVGEQVVDQLTKVNPGALVPVSG
jgi:protein-tyrosine phosphatase